MHTVLNAKGAFSNSSGFKSVFGKFRFLDGLVCMVGLTVEIKLRFLDGLVWTVGLINLRINKATFSNSFGAACTRPQCFFNSFRSNEDRDKTEIA